MLCLASFRWNSFHYAQGCLYSDGVHSREKFPILKNPLPTCFGNSFQPSITYYTLESKLFLTISCFLKFLLEMKTSCSWLSCRNLCATQIAWPPGTPWPRPRRSAPPSRRRTLTRFGTFIPLVTLAQWLAVIVSYFCYYLLRMFGSRQSHNIWEAV